MLASGVNSPETIYNIAPAAKLKHIPIIASDILPTTAPKKATTPKKTTQKKEEAKKETPKKTTTRKTTTKKETKAEK